MAQEKSNVATPSSAWLSMHERWVKIDSLLGGTEGMRRAGQMLLPQHTEESDTAYEERLGSSVLLNMTAKTLDAWTGKPFADPLQFEGMSPEVETLFEDVDLKGTHIQSFLREWLRSGLSKAFSHVLVDYPRRVDPEGRDRTLADDLREGLRPYWVLVDPSRLIAAKNLIVAGEEVLTHCRIYESTWEDSEESEWQQENVERVRSYDLVGDFPDDTSVLVRVFRKAKDAEKRKPEDQWFEEDRYTMEFPRIPLVPFYADREGFMQGQPPIMDLADVNIQHWQSSSDQRSILTVSRFPVLALSGGAPDEDIVIGPHKWLHSPDPSARFYYIEHGGQAISAGSEDLLNLESQMALFGAEFLRERPGGDTATAKALDSAEATSPLKDAVNRFVRSANAALALTDRWFGGDGAGGGRVSIVSDVSGSAFVDGDLNALSSARSLGDISRPAYLNELKRRGVLSDEFDVERNELELEQDALTLSGQLALGIDKDLTDE